MDATPQIAQTHLNSFHAMPGDEDKVKDVEMVSKESPPVPSASLNCPPPLICKDLPAEAPEVIPMNITPKEIRMAEAIVSVHQHHMRCESGASGMESEPSSSSSYSSRSFESQPHIRQLSMDSTSSIDSNSVSPPTTLLMLGTPRELPLPRSGGSSKISLPTITVPIKDTPRTPRSTSQSTSNHHTRSHDTPQPHNPHSNDPVPTRDASSSHGGGKGSDHSRKPSTDQTHAPPAGASMKRGQGFSCHHCKTHKTPDLLLFCSNQSKSGAGKKSKCRKKYCDSCLRRLYGLTIESVLSESSKRWQCPACLGNCVCAGCERKTNESSQNTSNNLHGNSSSSASSSNNHHHSHHSHHMNNNSHHHHHNNHQHAKHHQDSRSNSSNSNGRSSSPAPTSSTSTSPSHQQTTPPAVNGKQRDGKPTTPEGKPPEKKRRTSIDMDESYERLVSLSTSATEEVSSAPLLTATIAHSRRASGSDLHIPHHCYTAHVPHSSLPFSAASSAVSSPHHFHSPLTTFPFRSTSCSSSANNSPRLNSLTFNRMIHIPTLTLAPTYINGSSLPTDGSASHPSFLSPLHLHHTAAAFSTAMESTVPASTCLNQLADSNSSAALSRPVVVASGSALADGQKDTVPAVGLTVSVGCTTSDAVKGSTIVSPPDISSALTSSTICGSMPSTTLPAVDSDSIKLLASIASAQPVIATAIVAHSLNTTATDASPSLPPTHPPVKASEVSPKLGYLPNISSLLLSPTHSTNPMPAAALSPLNLHASPTSGHLMAFNSHQSISALKAQHALELQCLLRQQQQQMTELESQLQMLNARGISNSIFNTAASSTSTTLPAPLIKTESLLSKLAEEASARA